MNYENWIKSCNATECFSKIRWVGIYQNEKVTMTDEIRQRFSFKWPKNRNDFSTQFLDKLHWFLLIEQRFSISILNYTQQNTNHNLFFRNENQFRKFEFLILKRKRDMKTIPLVLIVFILVVETWSILKKWSFVDNILHANERLLCKYDARNVYNSNG